MFPISYSISPETQTLLNTIEKRRRNILLTPISPKLRRKLIWDTMVNRLRYIPLENRKASSKKDVIDLLKTQKKLSIHNTQRFLTVYKNTYNRMYEKWSANPNTVTWNDIKDILEMFSESDLYRGVILDSSEKNIKKLLNYVQARDQHPLISISIILGQFYLWYPNLAFHPLANMLSYIFLFKYGFDINKLISLESILTKNPKEIRLAIQLIEHDQNYNSWISFVVSNFDLELIQIRDMITKSTASFLLSKDFFTITDRQQAILDLFCEPEVKITNKKVQNMFKVSQITASRDLSKLTALGLLLSRGKGRSVYYIKI